MAEENSRRRHWGDVIVIVTAMFLIGLAIRPGEHNANTDAAREAGSALLIWAPQAFAGAAALAAVFIAQRPQFVTLARILLVLGGLAMIAALMLFNDFGVRALLTMLLPGLLLLIGATSVGPMPRDVKSAPPASVG